MADPLRKRYLRMRGLQVRGCLTVEQVLREASKIAISDGRPNPRDARRLRRGKITADQVRRMPEVDPKVRLGALKTLGDWHGLGHPTAAADLDREIARELERITGTVVELPPGDVVALPAGEVAKEPVEK
jgi:hypothetical protein